MLKTKINKFLFLSLLLVFLTNFSVFNFSLKIEASSTDINQRLQNTRASLSDVSQRRTDLQSEVNRMQSKITEVENIIQEAEQRISTLQQEVEKNEAEIKNIQSETRKILKEIQISGSHTLIEQILSSQNLSELLNTMYIFSSRYEKLEENTMQLKIANKEKAENIEQQEKTKKEAQETRKSLQLSKEEKDYLLVHFQGQEDEFRRQVNNLQQQGGISVSTQRAETNTSNQASEVSDSGFIWPAPGVVTRCVVGGHVACDIANRSAPNLVAAQSGVVSAVYRYTVVGYGLAVVIDHGGGYQTLYAHMNRIDVVAGQQVSRGQVIGQMGTTGFSTGIHVHFEIRKNGVKQNPLRYLPPR